MLCPQWHVQQEAVSTHGTLASAHDQLALVPQPMCAFEGFSEHALPCMQVVLVSATLPVEVLEMTNKFMNQPLKVMVKRDELTLEVRRSA